MDFKQANQQSSEISAFFEKYGYGAGMCLIILLIIMILAWTFLVKRMERMAEDVSEKTLKKYQANIDKDLYKFQTTHQKQIDAIHEVYQRLQALSGLLHFVMNGEPFTSPMAASNQLEQLILCRHEFKREYQLHRLVFGKDIRQSMDEFLVAIDQFITGFKSGLMPVSSDALEGEDLESGLYIAGIWKQGELESLVEKVDGITVSIEEEFQLIYGTEN